MPHLTRRAAFRCVAAVLAPVHRGRGKGMAYVIPAITAPDQYTAASTIEGVSLTSILVDVVNAAIYWQLKVAPYGGAGGVWQDNAETPMSPGSRTITSDGEIVGIRVRAKVPFAQLPSGSFQAVVTVRAD